MKDKLTRREFLQASAIAGAGAILAACAPAPTATPVPPPATQPVAPTAVPATAAPAYLKGTVVRYAAPGGFRADGTAQVLAPEIEKLFGIKIQVDSVPYADLINKLTVALTGGSSEYDIILIDEPWVVGLASNLLSLDDLIARDKFDTKGIIPSVLTVGQDLNGKLVAMPLSPNIPMLWTQKDLLASKNAKPPATLDEVLTIAPTLADAAKGLYGWVTVGKKDVQVSCNAVMFLWSYGGDVFKKDGGFGFDSPEGVKALEMYKKLLTVCAPGVLGYAGNELLAAFKDGKAAMMGWWASNGPDFLDAKQSQVANRLGWAPLPYVPQRGVWSAAIPKASKNQAAAWEVVKYQGGQEGGLFDTMKVNLGYAARYDVLRDPTVVARFPWVEDLIKGFEICKARPRIVQWTAVDDAIQTMGSEVLSGQSSTQDAIKKASDAVARIMKT